MKSKVSELPALPDKRYFTISETADLCAVKPHVLRYWEQEFSMLKPIKRRGSRRYYQQKDVLLVRQIRELLYDKGFTISGARQQLKSNTPIQLVQSFIEEEIVEQIIQNEIPVVAKDHSSLLNTVINELESLLSHLKNHSEQASA